MATRHRKVTGRAKIARRTKGESSTRRRRNSGPKISSARLRAVKEDVNEARGAMTEAFENFWLLSGYDVRDTLAKAEHKLGRIAKVLKAAA